MEGESREAESLGFLLLSHHSRKNISHTLLIPIAGRNVRLCARCTGIAIGIALGLLSLKSLLGIFASYPLLIGLLPLPGAIDWLLQVFRVRQSTNPRRVVTGVLIGILYAVGGAALIEGSIALLEFFIVFWSGYFAALYLLFRKTGALQRYIKSAW